jgi:hypothetical protein
MRALLLAAIVTVVAVASGPTATFSVDGSATTSSTALATIQPRTGALGYSWLRVYFYSARLTSGDLLSGAQGRVEAMKAKWSAVLQLTLDQESHVWQVDLALPGHTCTIAESDRAATSALQEFRFDRKRVHLKGNGSHVCDMRFMGIPNQTFKWDVDLDSPVVEISR